MLPRVSEQNPYAAAPPPAVTPRGAPGIGPSRGWFGLGAALLALAGVAVAIAIGLVVHLLRTPIERFDTATPLVVTLAGDREYSVYVRTPDVDPPTVTCDVQGPNGLPLPLRDDSGLFVIHDGDEYDAVLRFRPLLSGVHTVHCESPAGLVDLGVGRRIELHTLVRIVLPIGAALFLGAAGVAVLVVTAVRRSSARRRSAEAASPWSHLVATTPPVLPGPPPPSNPPWGQPPS
jgi:hypothetical protein